MSFEEMLDAVNTGGVDAVRALLDAGASPDAADEETRTAVLHVAAAKDEADTVRLLAERGASVDCVDTMGWTPLMLAAQEGATDATAALLAAGADPARLVPGGDDMFTALDVAVQHRRAGVAGLLLEAGVTCANAETTELAQMLAELGDEDEPQRPSVLDGIDKAGRALLQAAAAGDADKVRAMMGQGACEDPQVATAAMMYAGSADCGGLEVVRALLEGGAPADEVTDLGFTPLACAVMDGDARVATARLLLDHGADVNRRDAEETTPLARAALGGHVEMARLLLSRGAAIEGAGPQGSTALDLALMEGRAGVVRVLLEAGADPNDDALEGCPPAATAARRGDLDSARALLEHGANPSAVLDLGGFGVTVVTLALMERNLEMTRLLLEHGAEAGPDDLDTAAEAEEESFGVEAVRMLLSYGARPLPEGVEPSMPLTERAKALLARETARDVPLVRECRAAVERAVTRDSSGLGADVAALCGDYVSIVGRPL